jgi:hypothetical protein
MKFFLFLAWLSATLLMASSVMVSSALAASGVMLKDDSLRASASAGAVSVGRVAKGATVDILARQGGWTQVAKDGRKGWVRILSVRATSSAGAADFSGLIQAGTQRGDSSRVVATAGLRGLNEEELKSARYDANELMKLDRYLVDRASAENYAHAVGLRHRDLDYPPAPKSEKPQRSEPSSPWGGFP